MLELLDFAIAVFAGAGQAFMMASPIVGAVVFASLAIVSKRLFFFALIGALAGTAMGLLLGIPDGLMLAGYAGANAMLVAILLAIDGRLLDYLYAVAGAAFSVVLYVALTNVLGVYRLPVLVAPFFITVWIFLLARFHFKAVAVPPAGFPPVVGPLEQFEVIKVGFRGLAQMLLQSDWRVGILVFIGLSAATLNGAFPLFWGGMIALLGSLTGSTFARLLDGPETMVKSGLFGFNGAYVALAMAGVVGPFSITGVLWAVVAACASALIMSAATKVLQRFELMPLSAPFVVTAWLFLLGLRVV